MGAISSRQWEGRRIVVCGGSRGIGKEMVLQLAEAKAELLVIGPSAQSLEEQKARCANKGFTINVHTADLSNLAGVQSAISAARTVFDGAVDGVFLNHLTPPTVDLVTNYTNEHIVSFVQANGVMMILLIRDFLPLLNRGVDSPFICYSHTFGSLFPTPGIGLYSGVKRMIGTLLDSLSQEVLMMGSPIKILQFFIASVETESYAVRRKVLLNQTGTGATPAAAASALLKSAASRTPKGVGPQSYLPIVRVLLAIFPAFGRYMGRSIAIITDEARADSQHFLTNEDE
ncbi:hypothetical protein BJ742DRAFT_848853 [Cladochytrium replicatum]|nr:hypothetical protein BJ742DRAFT_848853 [Cladochytrium replicatum]